MAQILLIDFSNAFNSVSREHMFRETRASLPGLSSWVECCYSTELHLLFGDYSLLSRCGVQQGDPRVSLSLFNRSLRESRGRYPASFAMPGTWMMALCGTPQDLAAALKIIEEEGPLRGLHLNRHKSLLYIPPGDDLGNNPLPQDIPVTSSGFCLLGVPLGSSCFCESSALDGVGKIQSALRRLGDLEDSQLQTTLLRSCLSLPKFNFALRTCPPSVILKATSAFDAAVREALEDITGGPLSDWAWLKANLPCSLGGLNLRSAALHAPAACISSIVNSFDLVSQILGYTPNLPLALPSAISSLAMSSRMTTWCSLEDIDVPLQQKSLSRLVHEACFNTLVESASDVRSRALALSSSASRGGLAKCHPITSSWPLSVRPRVPAVSQLLVGPQNGG